MSEEDAREAARLGFDIARSDRLRELFDHYDVDQSRALDANELECMLAELGHEADHTTARVLQDEFGDVPRSDEADGRAISFPAFMRLVAKVENKQAELSRGEPTATRIMTALIRRFSLSTVAPAAELTRDGSTGEAGGGSRSDDTEDCDREPEATENAAGAAAHSPLPAANELVSGTMEDAAVETEDGAAKPLFKTLLEKRFAALKADRDNAEAARGNANTDEADHAALNIDCGGERHRERHIAGLVNETYDVVPTAEGKDDFSELDDLRGEDAYGENGSDGSKNDRRSHISGYDRAAEKSFFRCVEPRSRRRASEESVSEPTNFQYPDDFVVSFDGTTVGTILRKVGQGAMGTVYQMRLTDGSICAAKAVRPDVSPEERNQREKDLAAEVTFGFTMGRSPFVMSVFRMVAALPDTETTALGLLLLCAFVDGGDLEEAMSTKEAVRKEHPDYKGDLWVKNSTIWPVASVTLQIFMAFEHCHERGVFHQDFKPANLMLCLDGVAKLCDFGLASFTRRVSFDPWTKSEPEGGQLCSQYTGGTVTYFSPEQIWLKGQLGTQVNSEQAYHELKQTCPLTPAVCDLYAASLVVLEMHSRTGPPKNDPTNDAARIEAVHRCAARKPRETVVGLSPEETEQWLVDDLGFAKLEGRVASNNVTSDIIMRMPSLSLKEAKQELKDIPGPVVNGLHSLAKKALATLSTSTDSMHENVQNLLEKMFSPNVVERPVTAACAFKQLMAPELHQYLPEGTNARAIEHSDDEVASTLGGLAKLMVLHGDIPSALTTVAEWMGMSFNAAACSHAQSAFCDLLKRHGDEVLELDLSRSTHSNWPSTMLSGKGFLELLASCLWARGALMLETIDFTDQSDLTGEALSRLLHTTGIPTLRTLTLRGCVDKKLQVTGEISASIRNCTALVSLDLRYADHTGAIPSFLADLSSLETLNLGWNRFHGEIPAQLGHLSRLRHLVLAGNSLDGSVPAELGGICSLLELDLMGNRLGGELPLAVIRLKAAEGCDTRLSQNYGFTLPNDLAALDIVDLDVSHCSLHGSLPCALPEMLQSIILDGNPFSSEIPRSWTHHRCLKALSKTDCGLDSSGFLFDDEADLARWLGNHGVDVLRFGEGEAKTICHLFGEVDDGKCAIGLEARNGEATVVRSVTTTWIKLRHGHKILVEKQQLLEDGRKRLRKDAGRSLLVGAKNKKGEAWRDAALRTLRAELGLRPETVGFCDEGSVIKKSRSLESPSFPGIATTYTEIHCEAKLLREKLSSAEREHLGLTAAGDADFRTKQNGRGGSIHHFWSWESAAVWRMLGDEFIRPKLIESTSEHEPEPGGSQQEEARVLLKPNLVTHLQGPKMKMTNYEVKALRAAMRRGLIRMWPESAAVEVELLFGGRSGSLVLDTTVRDHKGGVTLACVIKIDRRADLEEELKQTQAILPHLGENAPKILCGGAACFEELAVTMNMGQRTDTTEIGLLAIELVGAAWVSPEFSQLGGKLMSTFEELFKWEVANADGRSMSSERGVFGEVPTVLSDVFSASGILTHVAQSTAKRSRGMAWFAGVVKKLQMRLDEATSVSEKNREPWCRSEWYERGGETCREAKREVELFIHERSSPPEWLAQNGELLSLVHGDFHGGNLLVDLKGTPWVIDYGEVHEGPVAYDIARLTTGMLFEYTPLKSELDLEAACRLTSELFAVDDLRQVPPLPCFDGLTPSLSFAAKSVHGLLGHLNGFTRKAQRNDRSHHDFHSLIFLLILLERTLRHLTYPQLSDLQKRWALRTAAKMSQRLRVVWDRTVPPEDSADDAAMNVANSSKSSLGSRFSARLWEAQRFDTLDVAWAALHKTIAQDRDVIARLITELEREHRENVQKAQAELKEARANAQKKLDKATEDLRKLPRQLSDWLSLPQAEALKKPPALDAAQRRVVEKAIGATMTLSHQVCWQSFCLTELPEGRYELFHASSNDVHAWFYRPGQQLLVEVEGQQWREASIVEMQADGAYCVRVYYDTTQQVDAIEVRLTEKNHVVSACYRHPKGSGLCLFHRAGGWRDVVVRETIDGSNWHRVTFSIRPGDETTEEALVLLNPFNHSLRLLPSRDYDDAMRKYRAFVMSRYGFIADALTGERLSIEDQIIKLELSDANTARGGTSGQDQLLAMTNPVVNRNSGFRDVSRVLVEAEAAGGKSVMMRQCLHACCKWDHRDKNDTVPILVLIIDLQRSMAKFVDEYHETEDLVGVYLRLNHPDDRCDALMQAYESRRALLLLDGVDEGGELKPRIESFITEFLVRQRISVVVTTRPEGYAKARYTDFQRMTLAPLDRKQQEQIIENRVGRLGLEALSSSLETMKDSEGQSICSNPLMLSMVISIFQSGGGRLPSSRYELYEKAIDTVLRRADVKQLGGNRAPGTCGTDLSAVQRLLSLIAVRRHHEHDKDISVDDITIVVRDDETLGHAWQHIEAQLAMGRLPVLSCLDPRPQLKIRFAHLSFQEFLVAQEWVERHANFGVESNMHERIPSLVTMLNDGWWHNTMRMACEQSEAVIHTIVGPHLSNSETVLDLSHASLAGDSILDLILGCGLISPNLKELKLDANSIEGQVSNEMFGLLCRLEHFDLSGNPGLDQSTLAGYLACTQKNLKDATRIDARDKGLKGKLPKQLPVSLEVLQLSGGDGATLYRGQDLRHKFTGGIPPEWGALTNLKELKMANCGLDGEIPVALLRWKFVENRTVELKGNAGLMLPSNIGELGDSVTKIELNNHNLRGPLPKVLPTSLEVLDLSGGEYNDIPHKFTGGIPPEWGALTNLKKLNMANCSLDGELPVEIIRLKANGVIPHGDWHGNGCGLAGNKGFTLPSNIRELGDDITKLELSNCSLTGPLPKMLPTSLEILDISGGDTYSDGRDHHKFTGGIPPEWGALTNLKQLNMARCGLDGQLPKELGKLVNLEVLDVSYNTQFDDEGEPIPGTGLSGELPLEIIRMKAKGIIPGLGLHGNKGFTLPLNIGELGDDITKLDLSFCSLTGELPLSIGRLKANGCEVDLSGNEGFTLSADTTDVMNDTKLDFRTCYLRGPLPKVLPTSLEILDISGGGGLFEHHKITGGIPPEWGALTNLKQLEMARCGLDGKLPKLPVSLEVLDVSGDIYNPHKFTGGIPSEWGALTNLKELKMAYCGLDGELPLEIIRMLAKGIIPNQPVNRGLSGNMGFTLPADIGELGDDITKLDLSNCSLTVSDAEKAALKAKLPNCRIYF